MSSTSTTQYYGLTQYVGTDKPDFADNNVAFRDVDAALHGVVQDAEGFATDITNLQTDVAAAQSAITTLQTDLDTAEAAIVTINNKDLAQDAEISRVDTNSKDMITAYNEASATSTHAYAIGDYFIYNNVLYRAIAAIAIGDTIVPDTNCTTTNVGAELIQLNSDLKDYVEVASITSDGVKTYNQVLTELANLVPAGKFKKTSLIINTGSGVLQYHLNSCTDSSGIYSISGAGNVSNHPSINELAVIKTGGSSSSHYYSVSGTSFTDNSDNIPTANWLFSIVY